MKNFCSVLLILMGLVSAGAEQAWVALSKVGGLKAYKGKVALFGVKEDLATLKFEFRGEGAGSFQVMDVSKEENGLLLLEVAFVPTVAQGYFSAELVVGAGEEAQVIQLRGVATPALEGKNEPPLQEILNALGAEVDAGGTTLSLNTSEKTIGDAVKATQFEPVKSLQGKPVVDAYVVGFEDAANGDYQDAVFLIEGVKAVK